MNKESGVGQRKLLESELRDVWHRGLGRIDGSRSESVTALQRLEQLEMLWQDSPFSTLPRAEGIEQLLRAAVRLIPVYVDSPDELSEQERIERLFGLQMFDKGESRQDRSRSATVGLDFSKENRRSSADARAKAEYRWRAERYASLALALLDFRAGGYLGGRFRLETEHKPPSIRPAVAHFVGRNDEIAELDKGAGKRIRLITGGAGLGKTTLALYWASLHVDDYPDGQVVVDMQGFAHRKPLSAAEAMSGVLRRLGLDPDTLPSDPYRLERTYQEAVADKKLLLILDNVRSYGDVVALVPNNAMPTLLITSRGSLPELLIDLGADHIEVGFLSPGEGFELLAKLITSKRVSAEVEQAKTLVEDKCQCHPLAISIVGANLRLRGRKTLAGTNRELATLESVVDLRLIGGARSLRIVFDWSFWALRNDLQSFLVNLTLLPKITRWLIEDLESESGVSLLNELVDLHLVEAPFDSDYQIHDLMRAYLELVAPRGAFPEDVLIKSDARVAMHFIGCGRRLLDDDSWVVLPFGGPDSAEALEYTSANWAMVVWSIHWSMEHGVLDLCLMGYGVMYAYAWWRGGWELLSHAIVNGEEVRSLLLENPQTRGRVLPKERDLVEIFKRHVIESIEGWQALGESAVTAILRYYRVSLADDPEVGQILVDRIMAAFPSATFRRVLPPEVLRSLELRVDPLALAAEAERARKLLLAFLAVPKSDNKEHNDEAIAIVRLLSTIAIAEYERGLIKEALEDIKFALIICDLFRDFAGRHFNTVPIYIALARIDDVVVLNLRSSDRPAGSIVVPQEVIEDAVKDANESWELVRRVCVTTGYWALADVVESRADALSWEEHMEKINLWLRTGLSEVVSNESH